MADIYPRESAIMYKTIADNVLELNEEPEIQRKFALSVFKYSIYGEYDYEDDPIIRGLMKQPIEIFNRTAARYDKIKDSAAAGGAISKGKRERWTNEDVYQYYKIDGHSLKDSAAHFGYSERTIQDKCKKFLTEKKKQIEIIKEETPQIIPAETVSGETGWKF